MANGLIHNKLVNNPGYTLPPTGGVFGIRISYVKIRQKLTAVGAKGGFYADSRPNYLMDSTLEICGLSLTSSVWLILFIR